MPAKTSLDEVKRIIGLKNTNLEHYAIGLQIFEQSKARPDNDVIAEVDSGFYHTLILFGQLAETHPVEARQMIKSVLSFDTMGRYLLADRPVVIDQKLFDLSEWLKTFEIDITAMKELAENNCLYQLILPGSFGASTNGTDKTKDIEPILFRREFSTPISHLKEGVSLLQRLKSFPQEFSLISKPSTEENIHHFLEVVADAFAHAKVQDSSKLDTLNVEPATGTDINDFSIVTLLQNHLGTWLVLSLIQSSTRNMFDLRMKFILSLLDAVTKKDAILPANANADLYMPLFPLINIIKGSGLVDHPIHRSHSQGFDALMDSPGPVNYTRKIKHLPSMRMVMTKAIAVENPDQIDLGLKYERNGKAVQAYFMEAKKLKPASEEVLQLMTAQANIATYLRDVDITSLNELLVIIYPVYKKTDSIPKQLHTLHAALLSPELTIYYQKKTGKQGHYEGREALNYIERRTKKIQENSGDSYSSDINKWGATILAKVAELKSVTAPKKHDGFFSFHRKKCAPSHMYIQGSPRNYSHA